LLMAVLIPALQRAKESGKRAICLNNLHQLSLAWILYTDANGGKLVSALAAHGSDPDAQGADGWIHHPPDNKEYDPIEQEKSIKEGALYSYCKDMRLYRCPAGLKGHMWTYGINDAMNGGSYHNSGPGILKMYSQIKMTYNRIVFVDEGRQSYMGYATLRGSARWYDPPSIRHSNGGTFSFADGHSEYWKWRDRRTIDVGKKGEQSDDISIYKLNIVESNNRDLIKLQKGCWGKLTYTPDVAPW